MHRTIKASSCRACQPAGGLTQIRSHIAASLIGQAVDLLLDAGKIAHGVVSGVQLEGGAPKLLVSGGRYDLDQVLTAIPATLN